jgi:hypothetical protein
MYQEGLANWYETHQTTFGLKKLKSVKALMQIK